MKWINLTNKKTEILTGQQLSMQSGTVGQSAIGLAANGSLSRAGGFWYRPVEMLTSMESVEETPLPGSFQLEQNYPNPFNPTTIIQFSLPKASDVTIKLYDVLGREVGTLVDENYQPGVYKVELDARDLQTGLYVYRLQAEGFVQTRKMMLLR